jgi:hypothetical protein
MSRYLKFNTIEWSHNRPQSLPFPREIFTIHSAILFQ